MPTDDATIGKLGRRVEILRRVIKLRQSLGYQPEFQKGVVEGLVLALAIMGGERYSKDYPEAQELKKPVDKDAKPA